MLDLAVAMDGNDAVDELFDDPPATEEHLFDPWTLLEDDDPALEVTKPRLPAGEEELDSGPFGALSWYLLLAERMPLVVAFDAADGWGGDSYVAFERDGVTCVRMHLASDSTADRTEMQAALRSWIAALPGAPASVTRHGAVLQFESCDPGTAADVGRDSSADALQFAVARTYLARDFYRATHQQAASRCFADKIAHTFTPRQLADPRPGDGDLSFQARINRVALSCL
jgi:hypothetical protein